MIALGIDTGGTYTDAVLVVNNSTVINAAKSLTTRRDLSIGIGKAIAAVFRAGSIRPDEVDLVALSTTFATNAIVEGQGSPVCLLLIGYDPELIQQYGFERELGTHDIVYLEGGHDVLGDEVRPLDEAAAREAILARIGRVEAFAVSSYFGVRNPAHELRVCQLVEELTETSGDRLPATCGHELTSRLNSVRRATTAALNARLIPLLQELITTVRRTLDGMGIAAPLMVVKGDGSLVRAEWALRRPIETILSGPAASVVGAWHLAGRQDVWVVDMGGTTTDIAALRDGRPRLNPKGARVGRWQTMVEAADVHTVGLGGDSEVQVAVNGGLAIGPRRVVPLCMLASEHPTVTRHLELQAAGPGDDPRLGQFVIQNREPGRDLTDDERGLLGLLQNGPRPLQRLVEELRYGRLVERQVERMERERLVLRAGFTPTDALHCLGRYTEWDSRASRLGAELLAARLNLAPEEFCERVVSGVSSRASTELVSKVLGDEGVHPHWEENAAAATLLERALEANPSHDLGCRLTLKRPVVAIGAPVEAYFPLVAEQLHTEVIIPPHAEVANAIGAVVGGVVQQMRVEIHPLDDESGFRAHLPEGIHDSSTLDGAVQYAQQAVSIYLESQARKAGAEQVEVSMVRHDSSAPVRAGWGQELFLGTELVFTAVGRPSLARGHLP
jgi:N-methylhydantoinase A/oxoprolinase/acetone carboxylase beta subunit